MSNIEGQIIKVRVAASATTINEVFHDETLTGKGQPDNVLGVSDAVLQNIDSKVADVQVNGTSVVTDNVADITVGNATLTIQKNGTDVDSFTANATSDKSINIEVPTKLSDISTVAQQAAIDSGITSSGVEQITTNKNNITTINEKIPAAASSSNQLADKSFVNSSVATNTANFIGTFNSIEELEAYSGTVTNNDYAFVVSTDAAGNTVYNRYKYTTATTPASWQFEYALNNSSFTSDQWAAINSGATTTNIGQIATNTSTISGHIANKNNPHEVTKAQVGLGNVDNTSDANKPVSTAQQTALDLKANSADVYTKTAADTLLSAKANKGLDNLNSTGANIANWSTNVSNCVVEITQDINLTLSSGTLTLKKDSKVYVPNGSGVFNTVNIASDKTITSSTNGTYMLFTSLTGGSIALESIGITSSGTTAPSGYGVFYDTSANTVYRYVSGSQSVQLSFPVAIITVSGGAITSIDKIFNGFGYIGNDMFVLPGVKCLVPNGRNTDGTLNNTSYTVSTVRTSHQTSSGTHQIRLSSSTFVGNKMVYNEEDNYNYLTSVSPANKRSDAIAGVVNCAAAGVINSIEPKTVFHAVDYSDFTDLQTTVDGKADKATTLAGYGITDAYTKTEANTLLSAKANTSLDNLTNTGANIGNWSHNVSNCVVEIPQDINLTLSSGTLTLKAGSKYYTPDGVAHTIGSDLTATSSSYGKRYVTVNATSGNISVGSTMSETCSGSTDALAGTAWHTWFDTENNVINYYGSDGTTVGSRRSFPIAIVTVSGGAISSIDQVFNGFGYIGSTVFSLPGVKLLTPGGLNSDGSLKTNFVSITSVQTATYSGNTDLFLIPRASGFSWQNTSSLYYDASTNYNRYTSDNNTFGNAIVGIIRMSSGKITALETKTVFHAVDYNDIESLSVNALSSITGYDATKTQTLKNVQGTLTWVDDA